MAGKEPTGFTEKHSFNAGNAASRKERCFLLMLSNLPVHPDNPRVAHRFEADSDEPLLAVQRVIEQIQEWQEQN